MRGESAEHEFSKRQERIGRRDMMRLGLASAVFPAAILNVLAAQEPTNGARKLRVKTGKGPSEVRIHYLEIVTKDVDAACALYSQALGVTFGKAEQDLGGARTANLAGGGMLGIRGPLRPTEKPVVRPYLLVADIKASVAAAAKAGAQIAMEPTEIRGRGQFAILIHGGIESGLWQV